MSPVVLLMMMALLAADRAIGESEPLLTGWAMPTTVCGALAAVAAAAWLAAAIACRTIDRRPERAMRAVEVARLIIGLSRWACLVVFTAAAHLLGWITWVADATGAPPLVADAIAVMPALGVVAFTWWAYHPVEMRMRQASLVRNLDTGEPVGGGWSRGRYTLWQVRHQMGLFVALFGVLLVWTRVVEGTLVKRDSPEWLAAALTLAGMAIALTAAPLLIRLLWDIEPLADGPLRARLAALCASHGVRVRRLLVWRTCGGMINAAVIGFASRLRYIMVTDGMIERLDDTDVEAIMAHEIGHVVRRHLPWMLVCAVALLIGVSLVIDSAASAAMSAMSVDLDDLARPAATAIEGASLLIVLAAWAGMFGVVSRRMERQADTFAAQHMASRWRDEGYMPGVIGPTAASIVAETLRRVAVLNHIPITRRAWRHGSMASRIAYLHSLVGTPVDACPIDRIVRRTCCVCLVLLIVVIAAMTFIPGAATI